MAGRRTRAAILLTSAASLWAFPASVWAASLAEKLSAIEAKYRGSLVEIRYTQQVRVSASAPPQQEELRTTGLLVSADGLVVASAIVYEPFNTVPHGLGIRFPASAGRLDARITKPRVHFSDGRSYPATLRGRDRDAELAFFRIDAEGDEEEAFRPIALGARGAPALGQEVVVLSLLPEPLGPGLAVELTRVLAVVSRPSPGFLVSTGAADPVGSLVCDLEGNPLGMLDALTIPMPESRPRNPLSFLSTFRELSKGVGRAFARPAEILAASAARPPEAEAPRRGWLGVEMQALTPELARHLDLPMRSGIVLGYVYERSPAAAAGLQTGDILFELDGQPIEENRDEDLATFAERVLRAGAGTRLAFTYWRARERRETEVVLEEAPKTSREAETVEVEELDLTVREVTYDYLAARSLGAGKRAVVVEDPPVSVRTNPHRIIPGDLLVRMNSREVADLEAFRRVVEELRSERPEEVVLFVERGRESFFFAVKPEWN